MPRLLIFIISITAYTVALGQTDTNVVLPHKLAPDTISNTSDTQIEARPTERNPKRAALMSLAVPGLGQIYNKKYWKLPIVYGALGATAYLTLSYRAEFNNLKKAYIKDINTNDGDVSEYYDPEPGKGYSLSDIQATAEANQTSMEYAGVAFMAFYALQVVDAAVDAHLYYFDVSEDLSLVIEPTIQYTASFRPVNSLSLSFRF